MTRTTTLLLVAGVALAATACTDSKQAAREATWGDRPADITCWTYGTQTYDGRSTGKVEYDRGGRIAFVDAANDRYTTVEGDCRVVYLRDGDEATPAPVVATAPAPTVAAQPEAAPAQ